MMPLNSCVICHKRKVHWHHIIKRKEPIDHWDGLVIKKEVVPNRQPDVPLCPKHHKLADLGKIPASELYRLKRLEEDIQTMIHEDLENQRWEREYQDDGMQWGNLHDFRSGDFGELGSFGGIFGLNSYQLRRVRKIATWLISRSNVGTYVFMNEMFFYSKKTGSSLKIDRISGISAGKLVLSR